MKYSNHVSIAKVWGESIDLLTKENNILKDFCTDDLKIESACDPINIKNLEQNQQQQVK